MIKFALDKVMKERNLTIQEVMNATGITRPTISQLSSGKAKGIQFDTLNKLVSGLRLETYELFDEIYPQEQLSYKINWIDLDMSADKIDENFTFDENEPLFEVNFFLVLKIYMMNIQYHLFVCLYLFLSSPQLTLPITKMKIK